MLLTAVALGFSVLSLNHQPTQVIRMKVTFHHRSKIELRFKWRNFPSLRASEVLLLLCPYCICVNCQRIALLRGEWKLNEFIFSLSYSIIAGKEERLFVSRAVLALLFQCYFNAQQMGLSA